MAIWKTHYKKSTFWYSCDDIETWWDPDGYNCSECGAWQKYKANFCPHCGKPMENREENKNA